MKKHAERIADFIQSIWYSYWRFAICNVLSQWITGIILAMIGAWVVQTLFSISISSIIDLVPDVILSFVCNNGKVLIGVIIIIMLVQVYVKHRRYKVMHVISEVPYDKRWTHEERLRKCDLGIDYCESRKEVLSVEKDFIKSFSPIPLVTAILGFVLEKIGVKNFNWQVFVIICIGMIVIYAFLCINNVRKFRENQLITDKWREARNLTISMQECH